MSLDAARNQHEREIVVGLIEAEAASGPGEDGWPAAVPA
jgi:hypothetical protein